MARSFLLLLFMLATTGAGCAQEADPEVLSALAEVESSEAKADTVIWIGFAEALERAEQSNKAILVDVYATWCGWCAKMQDEVYTEAPLLDYLNAHFETARLNIEETADTIAFKGFTLNSAELSAAFGAQGTPTTVFLDPAGEYITRLGGYLDVEGFTTVLNYIGSESYKEKSFEEFQASFTAGS